MATNLEKTQQGEHFRVLDPPSVPSKPFSPRRLKLALMGLAVGIVVGGVVAGGTELTDGRIYNEKEIGKIVSVEILAEIPSLPRPTKSPGCSRAAPRIRRRISHRLFRCRGFRHYVFQR